MKTDDRKKWVKNKIHVFFPVPLQPTPPMVNQRNFADDKCWQGPGDEENPERYKMEDAVLRDWCSDVVLWTSCRP